MTKKSNEFLKLDKEYIAELKLGYTSSTGDPEGEIQEYLSLGPRPAGANSRAATLRNAPNQDILESTIQSFIGKINQKVPAFSAVKINGQRAYKLARAGKDFETPTREIEIYAIEILEYDYPKLTIRCEVSSGTYIRTLAEDIGKALGTGAYLTSLRRTKIGTYDIKDAIINLC